MSKRMTMTEITEQREVKRKNLFLTAAFLKRGKLRLKQQPYNIDNQIALLKACNIKPEFELRR